VGGQVTFGTVLMVADGDKVSIGRPLVKGAEVKATVVSQGRGDKVRVFKMRRRKQSKKEQGHRQNFTEILVGKISA
jgi:large subunit ribosomal protein L21